MVRSATLFKRFAIVALVGLLAGCSRDSTFEKDDIRVSDVRLTRLRSGARIVTGTIENTSKRPVSGLQIQISLFDADNRRVDTMPILIQDLEPGESRGFREAVDSDFDVQGVRVRSLLFL